MTFEGRAIVNNDSTMVVYNCTPSVFNFECLKRTKLLVSDFCYNSDHQDKIFLSLHLHTAKVVREKLEDTECQLKKTSREIDEKKQQNIDVLYSVLPSFAADKYLLGEDFPPTKLDSITVLFSDIKGFTDICKTCNPVMSISMLNDLFSKYDDLTDFHDILKVNISVCKKVLI